MQFTKSFVLSIFLLGATAFADINARDEIVARDGLKVRDALQEAHEIAMRSDPDIFRRELVQLGKRGCVVGGRGACIRGKCSTSGYFCHPNGCACD